MIDATDEQRPVVATDRAVDAATWVRAARRWRRLSQRELAGMIDIPVATLARIESGRHQPRLDTFARILEAAGFALLAADCKGRLLVRDPEHDAIRDRGGRRFPPHLKHGGRPVYMPDDGPDWWGWHNIAWYDSYHPAVPAHVYWQRCRIGLQFDLDMIT